MTNSYGNILSNFINENDLSSLGLIKNYEKATYLKRCIEKKLGITNLNQIKIVLLYRAIKKQNQKKLSK